MKDSVVALHWFRKGLRLHDNPALHAAVDAGAKRIYPVYVLEPALEKRDIGINRYTHLLETLVDLDASLRRENSRLFVVQGDDTVDQLEQAFKRWDINLLTFEFDSEPASMALGAKVTDLARTMNIHVVTKCGHTLFHPEEYIAASTRHRLSFHTYGAFCSLFRAMGPVREPLPVPSLPAATFDDDNAYTVPTLRELTYPPRTAPLLYPGGESHALTRLNDQIVQRAKWVEHFEKPKTSPNALTPSTTVLSPYLSHGSLSVALLFQRLEAITKAAAKPTLPPVSLTGQVLWREFFYLQGATIPHFDSMEVNPVIRQIPWERDVSVISKWRNGQTGFPFIDAIMRQLKAEGWIHHLARHATACFLTRGDLWQHWEEGAKVFELYLVDFDWSLNNGNWQWLSCSHFYFQYFKCYSPVAFGKKTDPQGLYIKRWVPELRHFPEKYIYEPWKAPREAQTMYQCWIGRDYPTPMIEDHAAVSKQNMAKIKVAYANQAGVTSVKKRKADI